MKKTSFKVMMFLLFTVFTLHAVSAEQQKTIAILDFSVQSNNPDYTYLGKGFAEFISVELNDIPGITMVDRSKRNELLEEQAFSLSGFADEESAVEIGKLLTARYLISGEIFDMFGDLLVTVKMTDVESGEVTTSAKADGPPQQYKRIIRELSSALAREIAPETIVAQIIQKSEKEEKELNAEEAKIVITSFSEAVDAVDNNEIDVAKEKLKQAQKIDSTNKAVNIYLDKLHSISPKFNVELIYYAPSMNPALLGFLKKDRAYITLSTNALSPYYEGFPNPEGSHSDFKWQIEDGSYYALGLFKGEIGYAIPITENIAVALEVNVGVVDSIARDRNYEIQNEPPGSDVYIRSGLMAMGGRISLGYRMNPKFGIGLSAFFYNSNMNLGGSDGEGDPKSNTFATSATIGVYWKPGQGSLNLDSALTVPFIQEVYLDYDEKSYVAYKTAPYPVVWETTGIYTIRENKFFLAGKEVLEIYVSFGEDERTGVASRSISSLEYWFTPSFAARLGAEYDYLNLLEHTTHGIGLLGGISFKTAKFTYDINFTWMDRALRFYPGYSVPDTALLVQISYDGIFKKGGAK